MHALSTEPCPAGVERRRATQALRETIATNANRYLTLAQRSGAALAVRAGASKATIHKIAHSGAVRLATLTRVAQALEVPAWALLHPAAPPVATDPATEAPSHHVLTQHLEQWLGSHPSRTAAELRRQTGLGRASVGRLLDRNADIHVDRLAEVAYALGTEPWRLLVPLHAPSVVPTAVVPTAVEPSAVEPSAD